jgi:hypothetical protein
MICPACGKTMTKETCCLSLAQMKLEMRQERLQNMRDLAAPDFVINKELELIEKAEAEIRMFLS